MTGDGTKDLVRYEAGSSTQYLINRGNGEFEPAPELAVVDGGMGYAAVGDLNGDDTPDLVLATAHETYLISFHDATPNLLGRIDAGGPIQIQDVDMNGQNALVVGNRIYRQDHSGAMVELPLPEFARTEDRAQTRATSPNLGSDGQSISGGASRAGTDSWLREIHASVPAPGGVVYVDNASAGKTVQLENSGGGDALQVSNEGTGTALRVQSPTSSPSRGEFDFLAGNGGLIINSTTGGTWADMSFQTNGTTRMVLKSAGNLGIGTTAPTSRLHIDSPVIAGSTFQSITSGTFPKSEKFSVTDEGYVTEKAFHTSSDERLKQDVRPIEDALALVHALGGVTFRWRNARKTGAQVGFIAQDVEEILPEIVRTGNNGYKSVAYARVTALLVEAMKDLEAENAALEARVDQLESLDRDAP